MFFRLEQTTPKDGIYINVLKMLLGSSFNSSNHPQQGKVAVCFKTV